MEDSKERRKPGVPKGVRIGGRRKGTPNRITKDLRERISTFLEDNWEEAEKTWTEIKDPRDKLRLFIELASFAVPKMQAVSLDAKVSAADSVEDDLCRLAEEEKE